MNNFDVIRSVRGLRFKAGACCSDLSILFNKPDKERVKGGRAHGKKTSGGHK